MADNNPNDSNWCFRSETARLLALNVAQIHTGLREGDSSIDMLTTSFQQLATFCDDIQNVDSNNQLTDIKNIAASMSNQVNTAIVAFQFYDRLCQRLEHVQTNLHMLSDLITDEESTKDANGWQQLREKIKSSYTMETEHKMYEAVLKGASIEEALDIFKKEVMAQNDVDIELF
ncbi:MAG: hypothetical protein HWE10_15510 [Gammaproteobacteria bacterium]|nr:hypothetical protein [Gammaproteobacteria bacterium]